MFSGCMIFYVNQSVSEPLDSEEHKKMHKKDQIMCQYQR